MFDLQHLVPAILLAIVPSLIYLVVLNFIDRYEKEPWTILLACVGLGGIAAPLISMGVLLLFGRPPDVSPHLAPGPGGADPIVGIVEEVVKGLLLLGLVTVVRHEFDDVLDGVIYGAALGAGFGAAETFIYLLGGTGALQASTVAALVVSGLDHAFYTAVFGAILGYSGRIHRHGLAYLVIAYGLATAALLHSLHDALPVMLARLVDQPDAAAGFVTRTIAQLINVLGLITIAAAVFFALRREGHVLHEQLADEVQAGIVTEDDYRTIRSLRQRLARERDVYRESGLKELRRLRTIYALEGELAFHKWRLTHRRRRPPEERTEQLRERIRELRGGAEGRA